jgi:hypothetical protein
VEARRKATARRDPIAAFAHRRIGQSDGVKIIFIGLDAGEVNLNLDDAGINAIHPALKVF